MFGFSDGQRWVQRGPSGWWPTPQPACNALGLRESLQAGSDDEEVHDGCEGQDLASGLAASS
jgi:hypothetical protein